MPEQKTLISRIFKIIDESTERGQFNKSYAQPKLEELAQELSSAVQKAKEEQKSETNELLADIWEQFAYPSDSGKWSGGLSTLEWLESELYKRKVIDKYGNLTQPKE